MTTNYVEFSWKHDQHIIHPSTVRLRFEWLFTQNVEQNTSVLRVVAKAKREFDKDRNPETLADDINGKLLVKHHSVKNSIPPHPRYTLSKIEWPDDNSWVTMYENIQTITHNERGEAEPFNIVFQDINVSKLYQNKQKRLTYSTQLVTDVEVIRAPYTNYPNVIFKIFNVQLPTIPRSSNFTVPGTIEFGTATTVNIAKVTPNTTHKIRFAFKNRQEVTEMISGNTFSWVPSLNYVNEIPNQTAEYGRFVLETYHGNKKIGEKEKRILFTVPNSIKPTLPNFTITDTNTLVASVMGNNTTYVRNKSNLQIGFTNPTGSYNSTINGYYAEIVGYNQRITDNNGRFGIMDFHGNVTIKAYVIDSRGRQSEPKTKSINIIDYFTPTLVINAERGGEDMSRIKVTKSVTGATLNNRNQLTVKYFYARNGGHYTLDSQEQITNNFTRVNESYYLRTSLPANSSYSLKVEVWDKFNLLDTRTTTIALFDLATEKVSFSMHPDGLVAGGTEKKGAFRVMNGDAHFDRNAHVDGNLLTKNITATTLTATTLNNTTGNTNLKTLSVSGNTNITGSLSVNGNITYKNKHIQYHTLTNSTGTLLPTPQSSRSADDILDTGLYYLSDATKAPTNAVGYLMVENAIASKRMVRQIYTKGSDGTMMVRVRNNGTWTPWKQLLTQDDFVRQLNSDHRLTLSSWTTTGVSGVFYRRDGYTIHLRVNIPETSGYSSTKALGTIPRNFIPQAMAFEVVTNGELYQKKSYVHVNTNGTITLVDYSNIYLYQFSISWGI